MKTASTYLYRPIAVRAIQLPPENEDPTTEFTDSLHELLDGMDWECGARGTIAIFIDAEPVIAEPGDWILRDDSNAGSGCEPVAVMTGEEFQRRFMPAHLSDEHRKLEAERIYHLTTP